MDSYSEQLIAKARTSADTAKIVLSLVGSALIAGLCVFFMLMTGAAALILLAIIAIGVGVWIAGNIGIEYEYIVTNDEMDIDKIIGKRKRKRMITVDIKKTTIFEALPYENEQFDVIVKASSGLKKDAYCMFVEHSDYGNVKIIFNPNRKTRDAIAQALPRQLREKVVKKDVE